MVRNAVIWILIALSAYQYFKTGSYLGNEYPRKPIRVVVPFQPGGGSDTFVRIVQKAINDNELMPQPLVIVNKPGGGTSIGSGFVKNARADGYTILCLHEALMVAKSTGQSPNGPDDYEPVAATGEYGIVVLVSEDSPYQSLGELMQAAKERPGSIIFGANLNTPAHFAAIMLEKTVPGAAFRFVATGGGAHRLAGVMGGHLDVIILSVGEYLRFEQHGLKAVAYLGKERLEAIPDIPTGEELGFPVYGGNLHYWWFPKGTDTAMVNYFADILGKVMQTDFLVERTRELQIQPRIIRGEELANRIRDRMKAYGLIKPEYQVELPDFEWWTLFFVLVFGSAILVKYGFYRKPVRKKFVEKGLRHDFAFGTMAMTVAYVLLMGLNLLSFVWATIIYLLIVGVFLRRFKIHKCRSVLEVALLMSFGLHFIFTQLFSIDLP
ncbi:MAG: hypothetical protein F7O42_07415 [Opitutae bacterium]|nr:hypothetical protein [Opitutae bacterium]